jgi:glucose-6-phosphate isomerase
MAQMTHARSYGLESLDLLSTVLAKDDSGTPVCELRLDTQCMSLPTDFVHRYGAALSRAHAAMLALESGAIANPDEKRMVGHYWLRDPSRAPNPDIAKEIEDCRKRIVSFADAVHRGEVVSSTGQRFRQLLLIGIGGSALGPQLVAAALGGTADKLRPYFFDNTDPDGFDRVLAQLATGDGGLSTTLVLVVSKSGGTKETRNGMLVAEAAFAHAGLPFARHAVAITQDGSELDQTAQRAGFLATFPMWDFVGGRTSVLSAVGLLPAALQGIDIDGLLRGARMMDHATRLAFPEQNPAMKMAVCWFDATGGQGKRDLVVLPYKDRLELLSRYLQQLIMESLGKEHDRDGRQVHQGIAVYGNKGATDQHAYVQQLRDGVDNFFVTFVEVLRDRSQPSPLVPDSLFVEQQVSAGDYLLGFLLGTQLALFEKGRRSLTLTVTELSALTLGALIALFERTVGYYAELVHVNAYHQPGVEAGKRAAASVLSLQKRLLAVVDDTPRTATELASRAEAFDDDIVAFKILEHLAENGRLRRHRDADTAITAARYSRSLRLG